VGALGSTETTERILGRVAGAAPGPTLVCVGGIHGNEPAGVLAIRRVLARLESGAADLRGTFVGLAGNRGALAVGRRYLSRDLNRIWVPEELAAARARLGEGAEIPAADPEAAELADLDRALTRIAAETPPGGVYLLDLHTTSGPGPAFALLDDTLRNRAFALALPVPVVLGIEELLPGTLLFERSGEGMVTLGFESGQHDDPASVDRAEAAVWIALEACGALPRGRRSEVAAGRRLLEQASGSLPRVVEIRYRHAIVPEDGFRMAPGFASFQPVEAGQPLAEDVRGPVAAREGGLLLMPLYQPQGSDGFFLARPVRPFWLRLSARLRRWGLHRHLHRLPGVHRHPIQPATFLVDRRVARWLVRETFHLLGYRRERNEAGLLVFRRRSHED
jgi:predicted deacylase